MTQPTRLLAYLKEHPGASSLEIVRDLAIVNTTGRISDLRDAGYRIDKERDQRGVWRYHLVTTPSQLSIDGSERLLA